MTTVSVSPPSWKVSVKSPNRFGNWTMTTSETMIDRIDRVYHHFFDSKNCRNSRFGSSIGGTPSCVRRDQPGQPTVRLMTINFRV